MEDFNTATLPDRKYYNLEAWHHAEQARIAREGGAAGAPRPEVDFANLEGQRKQDMAGMRQQDEAEKMKRTLEHMRILGKLDGLKEQEKLLQELQMASRMGARALLARATHARTRSQRRTGGVWQLDCGADSLGRREEIGGIWGRWEWKKRTRGLFGRAGDPAGESATYAQRPWCPVSGGTATTALASPRARFPLRSLRTPTPHRNTLGRPISGDSKKVAKIQAQLAPADPRDSLAARNYGFRPS